MIVRIEPQAIAQIAYAACAVAVTTQGIPPMPPWAEVDGDEKAEMLAYVQDLIAVSSPSAIHVEAFPSMPLTLFTRLKPSDLKARSLCARIITSLTFALMVGVSTPKVRVVEADRPDDDSAWDDD